MKTLNSNEARNIVGGKWQVECYAPSYPSGGQIIVRGYHFTRYSNDKRMTSKKADDVCGSYNFSTSFKKV
jgi:hypothetical protein